MTEQELAAANDEQLEVLAAGYIKEIFGQSAAHRFRVMSPDREQCERVIRQYDQ